MKDMGLIVFLPHLSIKKEAACEQAHVGAQTRIEAQAWARA